MITRRIVKVSIAIVGFLALVTAIVYAISPQDRFARNAAVGIGDTTPIAWVNGQPIHRDALEGAARSISGQTGTKPEDAYQEAFNLLIQNTLIKELATRDGITTTDQEVDERVQSLLENAKENPSLQVIYTAQAQEFGVAWDSPEFAAFLKQQWSIALPVEKWNAKLSEQAEGDAQKYREEKVRRLSEMLSNAEIRPEEAALPEKAKAIHIPEISELPASKEIPAPNNQVPTVAPSETIPAATPIQSEATISPPLFIGTILSATAEDRFVFARSGPGTTYERVGSIPSGQTVQVIGRNPERDWWQIRTDTLEGWVFSAYVHVEGDALAVPCISTAGVDCTPVAVPVANDQAIASIRAFRNQNDLLLTYDGETENPNADLRDSLAYRDHQGGQYLVDQETLRVAEWTPQLAADAGETKPVEELRALALTFAYHQSPRLAQNPDSLTFTQMTKDGSQYAFRWEDQSITGHMMTPFLQVVIRTDGEILQYINTLDIWTK